MSTPSINPGKNAILRLMDLPHIVSAVVFMMIQTNLGFFLAGIIDVASVLFNPEFKVKTADINGYRLLAVLLK